MESWLLDLLWIQSLQIAIVFAAILLAVRLLAQNRPHLAHALWGIVLIKAAILPWLALPFSFFYWVPTSHPIPAPIQHEAQLLVNTEERTNTQQSQRAKDNLLTSNLIRIPLGPKYQNPNFETADGRADSLESSWWTWGSWSLVSFWLIVALLKFFKALSRVVRLRAQIQRYQLPDSHPHTQLAQSQLKECLKYVPFSFSISNKITISVVEIDLGPAVIGLLNPIIILPQSLLAQCDAASLRPILTHELLHIRRNDIGWGLLQVLTTSLWWFNPLVHFASRKLDQETERCCDEETVANLQCKPSIYARSMLLVLQCQQMPYNTLAMPGVRLMEFNAERMKRIMTIKNKAQCKSPTWIRVLMLLGLLVTVPGATTLAQNEQAPTLPPIEESEPTSKATETLVAYQVNDVIAKIQLENPGQDPLESLKSFLVDAVVSVSLDAQPIAQEKLSQLRDSAADAIQAMGEEQVIVKANHSQHEAVQNTLQRIRRFGTSQLVLSTHMITVRKDFFEELNLTWSVHMPPTVSNPAHAHTIRDFTPPILLTEITPEQDAQLALTLKSDKHTVYHSAPRITVRNGQQASIFSGNTRAFGSDFVKRSPNQATIENSIFVSEGLDISYKPEMENEQVKLNLVLSLAKIEDVTQVQFRSNSDNGVTTANLEVPAVTSYKMDCTTTSIRIDHCLVAATLDPNDKSKMLLVITRCQKVEPRPNK
jgi:beta-lactamase regulating signal transducer with metallopeptidase domain